MEAARIRIDITDGPVPTGSSIRSSDAGGEVVFIGRTRAETHDTHGVLIALDYDLHEPLTRSVLEALAEDVARTLGARSIEISHARGMVPVGDASVRIAVLCPHRAEAFEACRRIIDELKRTAPIFKHERWAHGTTWHPGTAPPGAGT